MKKLFLVVLTGLTVLSAVPAFAGVGYVCSVNPNTRPYDTYFIRFQNPTTASVSIMRRAGHGSEEVAYEQRIGGCSPAQRAYFTSRKIYVECDGDGDAGFVDLRTDREGRIAGSVNFPEGKREFQFPSDTSIPVRCHAEEKQ